jgi:hypothetical protein
MKIEWLRKESVMYRFERLVEQHQADLQRAAGSSLGARSRKPAGVRGTVRETVGRSLVRVGERLVAPAEATAAR